MSKTARLVALPLAVLLLASAHAYALITSPLPLRDLAGDSQAIFLARVEALDGDKRTLLLSAGEALKGKAPFPKLPVALTGDADATEDNQVPQLLERLESGQSVVLFVSKRDKEYLAFVYVNGTWVQLTGVQPDGADEVRWRFGHFEPYLRRTFKGTTEEMVQAVKAGLADNKKWPAIDKSEKPGLGPKVDKKRGAAPDGRPVVPLATGPVFGVVVAPILFAPLSLLALLFPSWFGGVNRWMRALTMVSTLLTLLLVKLECEDLGPFWGNQTVQWAITTLCILVCLIWSWVSHQGRVETGEAPTLPTWSEGISLGLLGLLGIGALVVARLAYRQSLSDPGWMLALVLVAGCAVTAAFVFGKRLGALWGKTRALLPTVGPLAPRAPDAASLAALVFPEIVLPRPPALATETVLLAAMSLAAVVFGVGLDRRAPSGSALLETGATEETPAAATIPAGWPVRIPGRSALASSPLVDGDRVYLAVDQKDAFAPSGLVLCLDRVNGRVVWTAKTTRPVSISSPCLAGGCLFVGEGYHQDTACKLYCLDAATGTVKWTFATRSHVESSPCVVAGRVYVGAGDDGVYCVDAATGQEQWHYTGYHVDASPAVVGGRLYVGSGKGDIYQETVVVCLDAGDGRKVWQHPVDLPAWGSPTVALGLVYFGLGNGTFEESESTPAGALLCLRADDRGEQVFRYDVPDGVLSRPTVAGQRVVFGCRDSAVYALDRRSGQLRWKRGISSPVVTSPVVAGDLAGGSSAVYVLGSTGQVHCLAAETGKDLVPPLNLAESAGGDLDLWATPALAVNEDAAGVTWQLFFGATLDRGTGLVYCLEQRVDRQVDAVNPLQARYLAEGERRAARTALRGILEERFGTLPTGLVREIEAIDDLGRLQAAQRRAVGIKALDEFHP